MITGQEMKASARITEMEAKEWGMLDGEKETWKVKTLDEILQEKKRRREQEERESKRNKLDEREPSREALEEGELRERVITVTTSPVQPDMNIDDRVDEEVPLAIQPPPPARHERREARRKERRRRRSRSREGRVQRVEERGAKRNRAERGTGARGSEKEHRRARSRDRAAREREKLERERKQGLSVLGRERAPRERAVDERRRDRESRREERAHRSRQHDNAGESDVGGKRPSKDNASERNYALMVLAGYAISQEYGSHGRGKEKRPSQQPGPPLSERDGPPLHHVHGGKDRTGFEFSAEHVQPSDPDDKKYFSHDTSTDSGSDTEGLRRTPNHGWMMRRVTPDGRDGRAIDDDDDEDDDDDDGEEEDEEEEDEDGERGMESSSSDEGVSDESRSGQDAASLASGGEAGEVCSDEEDEEENAPSGAVESKFDSAGSDCKDAESKGEISPDYLPESPPLSPLPQKPELPPYLPAIQGCRSVEEFQCLNRIEEGTYGVVYRAKDKKTDEVVALKRLKMEKEKEGFPITSLREINTLLKAQHDNIVHVREIVVGSNMDKIYIVMNYVEHDLKSLMETMKTPFLPGEVKTLMIQLLKGVKHLHDNWILHRDLKTSNLLLSHAGILKIGDFGLAREYGSPLKQYTPVVVTLWYRAPELLLGTKEYSTPVDLWSVGCIFAELLTQKPLFPGKSEIDQINRIFKELGSPNEKIWPGYGELPAVKKMTFAEHPYNNLRKRFGALLSDQGFDLMNKFLTYCPSRRITSEEGLDHKYFTESPLPIKSSMFPTWPAKSEQPRNKRGSSPRPPEGGLAYSHLGDDDIKDGGFHLTSTNQGVSAVGAGFSLKF
uniref:cyclin-dependent kinase n=1 Tax=Eptatretus burgeri TaxID=7764 RepID=A0A8C4R356_EPTBU